MKLLNAEVRRCRVILVTNHSRQAKVPYLETRQQVCLLYFFRGRNFCNAFFQKSITKIAPSKKQLKSTVCRVPEDTLVNI